MASTLVSPLIAASDYWMAKWLTPFWFIGVGIVVGLLALIAVLAIAKLLVLPTRGLEAKRKDGGLHWVSLIVTLILGGLTASLLNSGELKRMFEVKGEFQTDEWLLVSLACTAMIGVVVWTILFCSSSRFFGELKALLFQGIGQAMLVTLLIVAAIGLAATPWVDSPREVLASVPQLFSPQTRHYEFTIPGVDSPEGGKLQKIDVSYSPQTLGAVTIESNRRILIADASEIEKLRFAAVTVDADAPRIWNRTMGVTKSPLPLVAGAEVFAQNEEFDDATVSISVTSHPPVPQAITIVLTALFVAVFGLLFCLIQAAFPKVAAIALSTAKSELSQPLPKILIFIVGLGILLFVFLPFNTLGEDIKLLKDCGVTIAMIAAIFQGVWSASTSVSDEIEGRTALTLLSKPIHRRSFIIGKILGIFWLLMFMFLIMGAFELFAVAYKPIYEVRENSQDPTVWQFCHFEMTQTIPGLALAFMQAVVLSAISVAIGTRVSMITNFAICFSIYVLGHLTPMIMESAVGGLAIVVFFSQLISAIVPNLNLFSMESAIDADVGIPWSLIASAFVYTIIYGIGATLLGLILFEDRDLA